MRRASIAICLVAAVLCCGQGFAPEPYRPTSLAIGWFEGPAKVQSAAIVYESSARIAQSQTAAIMKAHQLGIFVADKDILGPDKSPPGDIKTFLDAAAASGKPLPVLVRKWSNGRTTVVTCPRTFADLKTASGSK